MTLEEAVKALKGNDEDYKHELNVQVMEEIRKQKEEEERSMFPYTCANNLTKDQLSSIAYKYANNYKVEYKMNIVLSNPNGINHFKEFLNCKDKEEYDEDI